MQIYCPKCKTGYGIKAEVVPEKGRKLRCNVCGNVFLCRPEDLIDGSKLLEAEFTEEEKLRLNEDGVLKDDVPETPAEAAPETEEPEQNEQIQEEEDLASPQPEEQEDEEGLPTKTLEELEEEEKNKGIEEVQNIFKRLSEETEALFKAEKEEKPVNKIMTDVKKNLGLSNPRNYWYYIAALAVCALLALYAFRYEIVRKASFMNYAYKAFGIEARVIGEGLEFQNVSRREFEEDDLIKHEIKGFIVNNSSKTIEIPMILAEELDVNANMLQKQTEEVAIPLIMPQSRVAFSFVINKPSPLAKYVYLTFVEKTKN